MYKFSTNSFDEISSQLNRTVDWLSKMGIPVSLLRISKYKKDLEYLAEHYKNGTLNSVEKNQELPDLMNSIYESNELINLRSGLKKYKSANLIARLKRSIEGPFNPVQEIPGTNNARDICFELIMANVFSMAGFDLDFNDYGDMETTFENNPLFVECKRIHSPKNLRQNVKKAFFQLENRYRSNSDARGLIAISVDKIVNPDHFLLVTAHQDSLKANIDAMTGKFIRKNESLWQGRQDKRTIGVIVSIQIPAVIKNVMPTVVHNMGFNNTTMVGTVEHEKFIRLHQKILGFLDNFESR